MEFYFYIIVNIYAQQSIAKPPAANFEPYYTETMKLRSLSHKPEMLTCTCTTVENTKENV